MASNILIVLLGWIHIITVVFVLTPAMAKRLPPKESASLGEEVSKQFTKIGYTSIVLIALTGILRMFVTNTLNLPVLLNTSWGQTLLLKVLVFLVMIVLVTQITSTGLKLGKASGPEEAAQLQKRIGTLSKTTIYLGIIAILLAVAMRHGGF
jgi:uncharacterized membrane protein